MCSFSPNGIESLRPPFIPLIPPFSGIMEVRSVVLLFIQPLTLALFVYSSCSLVENASQAVFHVEQTSLLRFLYKFWFFVEPAGQINLGNMHRENTMFDIGRTILKHLHFRPVLGKE